MASNLDWFNKGNDLYRDEEAGLLTESRVKALQNASFAKFRTGTMVDRDSALKNFQAKLGVVVKQFKDVEDKFANLEDTYGMSLAAYSLEAITTLRADMEAAMNEIKGATQRLSKELKDLREEVGDKDDPQVLRMKQNSIGGVEDDLKRFAQKVFALQTKMKDDRRKEARNKLKAHGNKEPSEADVEAWAEATDPTALHNSYLYNQSQPAVQKLLREMEARHRAAKALETSVEELHQLFLDMQVLVHEQGQYIDNIISNLEQTIDYVSTGNVALVKAGKIKQHNNRFKLTIMIVVAVIIAVIVAVVLGTLLGSQPVK